MGEVEQVSKLEILTNLVSFYSEDPYNRRCQDDAGNAVYNGRNGKHCAIGQCLLDEYRNKGRGLHGNSGTFDELMAYQNQTNLDEMLDEEYRGHEIEFWEQVQHLHDRDFHWTETGLSEDGHNKIKQIKEQFNL